jgi:hypothetical protein
MVLFTQAFLPLCVPTQHVNAHPKDESFITQNAKKKGKLKIHGSFYLGISIPMCIHTTCKYSFP